MEEGHNGEGPGLEQHSSCAPPDDTNDTIYKIDVLRLISFTDWPVTYISRESLAAAGFYYMRSFGGQDRVRCAWCKGELMNWARGDDPLAEHLRHFPQCDYAKSKQLGSRSSVQNATTVVNNETLLEEGVEGVVLGTGEVAEGAMLTREAREQSFTNHWPSHLRQNPKELSAAGFYYVGPEDQVRCFQCGGSLKAWVTGDNPWIEHARWFPTCRYLSVAGDKRHWVEICMSQPPAIQALSCGLQPHTIRKAIASRLRTTGTPFVDTESLIDAALNEQINEQPFSVPDVRSPPSPPLVIYSNYTAAESENDINENVDRAVEDAEEETRQLEGESQATEQPQEVLGGDVKEEPGNLEEENRRLKEARMCKVCMDSEVGIVFLPCGHLVTCVQCSPCLTACPLCRAPVKGVVRTYLS